MNLRDFEYNGHVASCVGSGKKPLSWSFWKDKYGRLLLNELEGVK